MGKGKFIESETDKIRKSLERLAYYEKLAEQKQDAWDADPMNPDREEAADRAYELEFNEFIFASYLISRLTGIDEKVAQEMVRTKRNDLMKILAA